MKPHEKILIGFFVILFVWLLSKRLLAERKEKKAKDIEDLKGFLRMLMADYHEMLREFSQKKNSSKDVLAKEITSRLAKRLGTEFRVLIEGISVFPRKNCYPISDETTANLFKDVSDILSDIHVRYRKNPASLDALQKEFFQKLGGLIEDIL